MTQTENLTHCNISCMSQNFRLCHLSNLSVRNFRILLLIYLRSAPLPTEPTVPAAVALHGTVCRSVAARMLSGLKVQHT